MNRREFLTTAACASMSFFLPQIRAWAIGGGEDQASKKLVVIFLRGGVDGLNVVAPYGDPTYYSLRPTIALARPGTGNGALDLDGHFGLHPALAPLMPYWRSKSLAFVHASGSPDSSRSHFDAQDYMESGVPGEKMIASGWLNRLVSGLPAKNSPVQAISSARSCRESSPVHSTSPLSTAVTKSNQFRLIIQSSSRIFRTCMLVAMTI